MNRRVQMITQTHQLDDIQIRDLERLIAKCKQVDGSTPNVYMHILKHYRVYPTTVLEYENDQLIGFLSVYFFYDDAVEVSVLIEPENRRMGKAMHLVRCIAPLIRDQKHSKLIFSIPANGHKNLLGKKGFDFQHSEYFMQRDDLNPLLGFKKGLHFRLAVESDIPVLASLDSACFPSKNPDYESRFEQMLMERDYDIYLAYYKHHPIGKAHIRWQEHAATLSDIAILPTEQGKGFGSALIAYCVNLALSEGKFKVNLDVETHNKKALDLYIKLGFHVENACDYCSINLEHLLK